MTVTTTWIDKHTTRAQIEAKLAEVCHAAKREVGVCGTAGHPTPWDGAHRHLDSLLDAWRDAPT